MRATVLAVLVSVLLASPSFAADGVVSLRSSYDVKTTADRLEKILQEKGMTVFIRIDHAKAASKVGKDLRPTELIIFGNPKVGTSLMLCSQTAGIDLPLKALIWQDQIGQVWLSYNDPNYLVWRHHMKGCQEVINKITSALQNFATAAASP
ncbi:MAG: DUF302 domain-containing protein [Deltaproteobacteria bacterium]|nr:DUF302 domain-containing protein [Deltaproteobacteria bacterium]MBW2070078.1 DUF302 domain-containing protein [Deltaproteobacteria bacterium]